MSPLCTTPHLSLTLLILFSLAFSTHQSISGLPTLSDLDINDADFSFDSMDISDGHEDGEIGAIGQTLSNDGGIIQAVALLRGLKTFGIVRLEQMGSGPTRIFGFVKGLFPLGRHGFHVHQHRVIGGNCESAGEHYNPTKQTHGAPESPASHIGDLGNLQADARGISQFEQMSAKISLRGKYSVLERSLVVHLQTDDLGMGYNRESRQSGNSGSRIACGTIKFVRISKG